MLNLKSLLILFSIYLVVKSQISEEHTFNLFQIKEDSSDICRTHTEGDYSLVNSGICHPGCGGFILIVPTQNIEQYQYSISNSSNCDDFSNSFLFTCPIPSKDFIKIGSSGFSVICNSDKNVTSTPTSTVVPETSNETPSPSKNSSSTPSPTPTNSSAPTTKPTKSPNSSNEIPSSSSNSNENSIEKPNKNNASSISFNIISFFIFTILLSLL